MAKSFGNLKDGYEYHMPRDDEAWIQEQAAREAEADMAEATELCESHNFPLPCEACQLEFENSLELEDLAFGKGW